MQRYECVSGYVIADDGIYDIGDEVEGVGAVQYIIEIDDTESMKVD